MIPIDLTILTLPEGWQEKAANALDAVRAAAPCDRSAVIDKHEKVWKALSHALAELSHHKCWYCESLETRSDMAVDHFRPKRCPVECRPPHEGYWWLAFDHRNFRYSCTFCNSKRKDKISGGSGGKHDHFPLLDEGQRVFAEAGDLSAESPALLDPTRPADSTVLWFREDGCVEPRVAEGRQPVHYHRAKTSIDLYHLNHSNIVEARLALFREIHDLVNDGKVHFDSFSAGNDSAKVAYDSIVRKLKNLVRSNADYSAAARDMIRGLRDEHHSWIEAI